MSEQVTCALHNKTRLSKFCVPKPVLDAFGNTLRTMWQCRDDNNCETFMQQKKQQQQAADDAVSALQTGRLQIANITTGNDGNSASGNNKSLSLMLGSGDDGGSAMVGERTASSSNGAAGGAGGAERSDLAKIMAAAGGRYYDLSGANNDPTPRQPDKKLCFQCGLEGHERPKCPNNICRKCRTPGCNSACYSNGIEQNGVNVCSLLGVPPAQGIPAEALRFGAARCTLCHQDGHLDCVVLQNPARWVEQCIVCAGQGHGALQCREKRMDRWSDDMRRAATGTLRERPAGGGGGGGDNSFRESNNSSFGGGGGGYSRGVGGGGGGGVGRGSGGAGAGGGRGGCFNCGGPHLARECPNGQSARGGGAGGDRRHGRDDWSNNGGRRDGGGDGYSSRPDRNFEVFGSRGSGSGRGGGGGGGGGGRGGGSFQRF